MYNQTHILTYKEINDKNQKFKIGDNVRISKYNNIFPKGYTSSWSEEVFVIRKIRNAVPWTYVINDINGEEIVGTFYENELKKTWEKVIKYMLNGKDVKILLIVG